MRLLTFFFIIYFFTSCKTDKTTNTETKFHDAKQEITCNEYGCHGKYEGVEFMDGEDIAHQFSNKISGAVGNELKKLYSQKKYKKVDFKSIKMTTEGMGTGNVIYTLSIPFITVNSQCEAFTSFDHVGGWNHEPSLERRKNELKEVTLNGHELDISELKTTPEGLQEYWIQWKNKEIQSDCE